jgi:hypothetical protein
LFGIFEKIDITGHDDLVGDDLGKGEKKIPEVMARKGVSGCK